MYVFISAVHTILKDVYDPSVYFRFQPELSEDITIDESKPEKLALLCSDAEQFVSAHQHVLEQAVGCLMAQKTPKQKVQVWLNSNRNRIFGRIHHFKNVISLYISTIISQ